MAKEIPAVVPDKKKDLLRKPKSVATAVVERVEDNRNPSTVRSGNMMGRGTSKFFKPPTPPTTITG